MNPTKYEEHKEDHPHYSRLFVVCNKGQTEFDLRPAFEQFGIIEDWYMPRQRGNGESKGIAYIKYTKTSSAAAAIKNLHMKVIGGGKPIKVMIAANKNEAELSDQYGDKYTRLFIKAPKDTLERELKEYFSQFGEVQSVYKLRDKLTGEHKAFAYVKFSEFYDAAKAFEECDKKYRPIFAAPKDLKRTRSALDNEGSQSSTQNNSSNSFPQWHQPYEPPKNDISSLIKTEKEESRDVMVLCSPIVSEKHIYQLMNIIPGMVQCAYSVDKYNGICKTRVTYEDERCAAYAIEKLNKFEFPSGEILSVKPDVNVSLTRAASRLTDIVNNFKISQNPGSELLQLANAIEKASSLIKAAATSQELGSQEPPKEQHTNFCNILLPPLQPRATNAKVVQRLFIVCKPKPPAREVLHDAFCRFGDFIEVLMIPNKTFGFVKYASKAAAMEAMRVLNGAVLHGARLKVMEADERPNNDDRTDIQQGDHDEDIKRIKLE